MVSLVPGPIRVPTSRSLDHSSSAAVFFPFFSFSPLCSSSARPASVGVGDVGKLFLTTGASRGGVVLATIRLVGSCPGQRQHPIEIRPRNFEKKSFLLSAVPWRPVRPLRLRRCVRKNSKKRTRPWQANQPLPKGNEDKGRSSEVGPDALQAEKLQGAETNARMRRRGKANFLTRRSVKIWQRS